jgi:hypothetical protein
MNDLQEEDTMNHPLTTTTIDLDFYGRELTMLSIELLARDRRASTLAQGEQRNRQALMTDGITSARRLRRGSPRRVVGSFLVNVGTAIGGSSTDGRTPRALDRTT